jgi:hypothetical protein
LNWKIVLVVVLVLVIEPALILPKIEGQPSRRRFGAAGEDKKENGDDLGILNRRPIVKLQHRLTNLPPNYRCGMEPGGV